MKIVFFPSFLLISATFCRMRLNTFFACVESIVSFLMRFESESPLLASSSIFAVSSDPTTVAPSTGYPFVFSSL